MGIESKKRTGEDIWFRGYCKERGAWVYGNLCYYDLFDGIGADVYFIESSKNSDKPFWEDTEKISQERINYLDIQSGLTIVDGKSIGQFTGMKDGNGIPIIEGDILLFRNTNQYIHKLVYYDTDDCVFRLENLNISYKDGGHLRREYIEEFNAIIIGNSYDNPELLKND